MKTRKERLHELDEALDHADRLDEEITLVIWFMMFVFACVVACVIACLPGQL